MKQRFNHSGVHKNNTRDAVNRSVTQLGAKKLREAFDKAFSRDENKEEQAGGKRDER